MQEHPHLGPNLIFFQGKGMQFPWFIYLMTWVINRELAREVEPHRQFQVWWFIINQLGSQIDSVGLE